MSELNARIASGVTRILTPLLPPGFALSSGPDHFSTLLGNHRLGGSGLWDEADDTPARVAMRWQYVLDGTQNDLIHATGLGWPIWQHDGSNFTLELAGQVLRIWVENLRRTERVLLGEISLI